MPRLKYVAAIIPRDLGILGYIEGLRLSHNGKPVIDYFGGIPYALPPVGPFRFRRPRPLAPCYRYGHKANPGRFTGKTGFCPQPVKEKPDGPQFDEDCTQLNIYVPAGEPPAGGWPVMFFIHGGFLQIGSANEEPEAIAPLLSETAFKSIIVMPAYRLNAFGFLASRELEAEGKRYNEAPGNYGFWDQRLALEWTWKNITLFGGNHSQITVAGYSAGAHSAYQQLAHELYFVPDHKAIIKNIIMWSNSPGVQPKALDEQQEQFDELVDALGVPKLSSAEDKLKAVRQASASNIVAAQKKLRITEFRALTDGQFISHEAIASINNGDFAKRMKRRKIRLMIGENRDEHNLYRIWRTPQDSYGELLHRFSSDFPRATARKLMQHYCNGSTSLPTGMKDWKDLFGRIYADMQIHGLERGFVDALTHNGLVPGEDIFRYRIEKRMKCIDGTFPKEWGVTHSTDMAIWFWGLDYDDGLTETEKGELRSWNAELAAFVRCAPLDWGTSDITQARRLRSDGNTDVWQDECWEKGIKLWRAVNSSTINAKL